MKTVFVDIETYCPLDLKTAGVYKYAAHPEFEILMVAVAVDYFPVQIYTFEEFRSAYGFGNYRGARFVAHNANFERICFQAKGLDIPIENWLCTMALSAYCGLPLGLDKVSEALQLGDKGKLSEGRALIRYFCQPCKPTKTNGGRTRNLKEHDPERWGRFENYCRQDVEAEREIYKRLHDLGLPEREKRIYTLDQKINDTGVLIDKEFAEKAIQINEKYTEIQLRKAAELTGLDNPNSLTQLKAWLQGETGENVTSLNKKELPELIAASPEHVARVLELRQNLSKISAKKYQAMTGGIQDDGRARGLFQYYGAARSGRWTGRRIQPQNLPQNHLKDLHKVKENFKNLDFETLDLLYDDIPGALSQLIRTAIVPKLNHVFAVADFSAIEARVTAWLAGETWRLDVFKTHGKIYEASAAAMFHVPIEAVTKGSDLRQKGKIAELALGFGGAVGALMQMGGESIGISQSEAGRIVKRWRAANPKTVQLWKTFENAAIKALRGSPAKVELDYTNLLFQFDNGRLFVWLPSGRKLIYHEARISSNRITYAGNDKGSWSRVDTYGGKLTENIVQALARDLLAETMLNLKIVPVMHVHDEVVLEVPAENGPAELKNTIEIMRIAPRWAEGLPLNADGFLTEIYKKD